MPNSHLTQDLIALEEARWHALRLFNGYRVVLGIALLVLFFTKGTSLVQDDALKSLFQRSVISYFVFCVMAVAMTWKKMPSLKMSLFIQAVGDILFIILLMHALGGVKSGFGLLLVIAVAGVGLVSHGRLPIFFAAVASIGLLAEQTLQLLDNNSVYDDYTQSVMLSLGCFATAWLAHTLAKRTQQSEELATQRGVDLENLAQVNALITHEMHDGVIVVDSHLSVKHHNFQAVNLLNIEEPWKENTLIENAGNLSLLVKNWMKDSKENANVFKLSTESRDLGLRIQPIGADRSQGAVIFVEDWSQMQAQSHQNKLAALGRLTANIAHEIRNPLSAISHATQLLQEEDTGNDPLTKRMLQIISDNVQRVDHIVKDVLELNRRDRTKQELINLESFISEFHQQFCQVERIEAECFDYRFDDTQDTVVKVSFDYRHLNQILWNLCKNGWRHGQHKKGSLNLCVYVKDNSPAVRIEISDDGDGIPENVQAHLFEPFFTTETTGTGLGLYISKELAEANGAKIQYKPLQRGSQFIIHLMKA